jgi:hypothetical protein
MVTGKTLLILTLAILLLAVGVATLVFKGELVETPVALTFFECVERGYQVSEEVPRRCTTPEGISFTEGDQAPVASEEEPVVETPTSTPPQSVSACVVGGCSSQLCVEEGDPGMSTCEYRAEYACYRSAVCERQESGLCGWSETPELTACLLNPSDLSTEPIE